MASDTDVPDKRVDGGSVAERCAMLRDSATKYAARGEHPRRSRQLRGTNPGHDRRVWEELAELGWLGTLFPERFGGSGLGYPEMSVIVEALGRALFPEPVVAAAVLAGGAVLHGQNDALKARLLPAVVSGAQLPALAWREDGRDVDVLSVQTRCEDTADGVRISGNKRLVAAAAAADGFVVSARGRRGLALYWVPAAAVAPNLRLVELADGRLAGELTLDGVEVPSADCIAVGAAAERALIRAYDDALLMTAAELFGVLSRAFEITLDYLKTRVQFGKTIGSFQALQHRAVDLYIEQTRCRYTLDEILGTLSAPRIDDRTRSALASRAKARCSDASLRIAREAIQMHGAMGFADECDVGLYLKRAVTLSGWLGGAETHRRRFAQLAPYSPDE